MVAVAEGLNGSQSSSGETKGAVTAMTTNVVPAPIGRRFLAYAIDQACLLVGISVIPVLFGLLFATTSFTGRSIVAFVVWLLLAFRFWGTGLSPGKWLMGLQLNRLDGRSPRFGQAFIRVIVLWLPGFLIAYEETFGREMELGSPSFSFVIRLWTPMLLLPFIVCLPLLCREDRRGLHDLAAGTRVILRPR